MLHFVPCLLGTQRCCTRGSGKRCTLCIWFIVVLTPLQHKGAPRQMDRSWGVLTRWRGFAQACQMCLSHLLQQSQEESACACNGLRDRRRENICWRWDLLYLNVGQTLLAVTWGTQGPRSSSWPSGWGPPLLRVCVCACTFVFKN